MQHMKETIRSVLAAHGIERNFLVLLADNASSNFNEHSYLVEWPGALGGALIYRDENAWRAATGDDASCFDLWPWAVEEVCTDFLYAAMYEAGMFDEHGEEVNDCPQRVAAFQIHFGC